MLNYCEIKKNIDATWYEQPARVRVLAARYYVGAESLESLRSLTAPRHVVGSHTLPPLLTEAQAQHIIDCR